MPTEGERQCEFMCHIYTSEAPGSFNTSPLKKNSMFDVLMHLNIAYVKFESLEAIAS